MGGVAIIGAAVIGYLASHLDRAPSPPGAHLACWRICGAALVGFADDWIKVTHQRSLGLNKRAKAGGQLAVAAGLRPRCA